MIQLLTILVVLIVFLFGHASSYLVRKKMAKGLIYEGVKEIAIEKDSNFVPDFAFARRFRRALKEYEIAINFAIRGDEVNYELLDQVTNMISGIVLHKK